LLQKKPVKKLVIDIHAIGAFFENVPDPRHTRNRKHALRDILVIVMVATLCGCDGPTSFHRFASRAECIRAILPPPALPNGIPSKDCFRRVLLAIKPELFQQIFEQWRASLLNQVTESDSVDDDDALILLSIDGKTLRGSQDAAHGKRALHVVSAWASEEGLAFGQVMCEQKSNEIAAIPELLTAIDLPGKIISMDAMGCQHSIAEQIVGGGGDFVIAVKKNQPKLYAAIEDVVFQQLEIDYQELRETDSSPEYETLDQGHGRIDKRCYRVLSLPKDFAVAKEWPEVKAVGSAVRISTDAKGKETAEVRYYILSRALGVKRFAEVCRGHWGIESMHWVLDVVFREDDSKIRQQILANNLAFLKRYAIGLLKHHPDPTSLRGKMQFCNISTDYLMQVLTGKGV
jgi:predicted transposase YbfD/YdcC